MEPADLEALYGTLMPLIADGRLKVEVAASYPLEDVRQALAHAAREARGGKVLLLPNGPLGYS